MASPAPDASSAAPSMEAVSELLDAEADAVQALPPALPPRPPPRPRQQLSAAVDQVEEAVVSAAPEQGRAGAHRGKSTVLRRSCWLRKYVFLCTACGGLAVLLGALFLTVYFMLRSYTSSLNYFETVPTYVPAAMLIVTGLIVMCLAGRRNRYGYLIKLCWGCCLACAVLCVVVTITTTVIHMNRLQTLRECVYTQKTQTCTCYSVIHESSAAERGDEGVRYVFNSTPDCEVIHGALYSCLRAMFGLSVIGILICIFSCMLVYQLLSHEKKKMYWEQLEMRCRYLYRQQRNTHHCTCCDECRYPPPPVHELFPWEVVDDRYWTPGRVGNLYSPNPGEEVTTATQRASSGWSWRRLPWTRSSPAQAQVLRDQQLSTTQGYRNATSSPDSQYGFSSRPPALPVEVETHPTPYRGVASDPRIIQNTPATSASQRNTNGPFVTDGSVSSIQIEGYGQRYYMWGPPPPYSNPHSTHNSPARREPILNVLHHGTNLPALPAGGTSSPSSRFHYQHHHHLHHHHHHCQMNQQGPPIQGQPSIEPREIVPVVGGIVKHLQRHRGSGGGIRRFQDSQRRFDEFSSSSGDGVINMGDGDKNVTVENYMNTSEAEMATSGDATSENNTDSSAGKERISNTLPARKTKKRIDISSVKSVANIPFSLDHQQLNQKSSPGHFVGVTNNPAGGFPRTNVQVLFGGQQGCHEGKMSLEEDGETFTHSLSGGGTVIARPNDDGSPTSGNMSPRVRYMAHLRGVSNAAFQEQENGSHGNKSEPTESEVYFADVSSCCNVSVRNDGQDSSLYDEALDPQKQRLIIMNQQAQRLPQETFDKNHHHHRRLLQSEAIPVGSHHQFQRHAMSEGVQGHQHHHRIMQEGTITCIGPDEQELSSNCFSYQRQSSTRSRMPFPLPHHPNMLEQDSSTIEEDMEEGVCRKMSCGRDFIDSEMLRKSVVNNSRQDIPKDPSQQSISLSSSSTGTTPMTETNESSFVSPMSISTSSPSGGSFPTESEGYYHTENGSLTEIVTPSGSASVICSSSSNEVFENYPTSPQKLSSYDQNSRLHQQSQRNNNNFHENQQEFIPIHGGGDQHFLAPDAQYETIPQQTQNPQSYQCHMHQKGFPQSREDFNGNTPPNSPGKNNNNNLPSTRGIVMAGSTMNVSSPARRRLNLPLHITTGGTNMNNNNANSNASIMESLYHTATSTEEDESEGQQQQSSSNCYSDATMDSGCHSGSEFASRRRGGSTRVSVRGGAPGKSQMVSMTDEDGEGGNTIRSVNV